MPDIETTALPCIIVHGGVDSNSSGRCCMRAERLASCQKSAKIGYDKLMRGASALEAVEAALRWLEDDELFNCGYGSALNQIGEVRMSATLVDGLSGKSGSVLGVSGLDHPISLAACALRRSPNVVLWGEKAHRLGYDFESIRPVTRCAMVSPAALGEAHPFMHDTPPAYATNPDEAVSCLCWDGKDGLAAGSSSAGTSGSARLSVLPGSGIFASRKLASSVILGSRTPPNLARTLASSPNHPQPASNSSNPTTRTNSSSGWARLFCNGRAEISFSCDVPFACLGGICTRYDDCDDSTTSSASSCQIQISR